MNILFYFEPWVELARPKMKWHNLTVQMWKQIKLLSKNNNVLVLIGDAVYSECQRSKFSFEKINHVIIKENDLRGVHSNYSAWANCAYRNSDDSLLDKMAEVISSGLDGFFPDVVISYCSPVDFLKRKYPLAKIIYTEFGIFSRAPFPETYYFDHCGLFSNSYIKKTFENRNLIEFNDDDKKRIDDLRFFYEKEIFSTKNPISRADFDDGTFEKIVLLPLQFSGYFGFDCCCDYSSQFDYLRAVLDRIPRNVGVIVTRHNTWGDTITDDNIGYLKHKYSNLIYLKSFENYSNVSQLIVPLVDGVISVSSSVGLNSVFWDKPFFYFGDSHLNYFGKPVTFDIVKDIENYQEKSNDDVLHHLITSYWVLNKYRDDGKWLNDRIRYISDLKNEELLSCYSSPREIYQEIISSVRMGSEVFREKNNTVKSINFDKKEFIDPQIYGTKLYNLIESATVVSFDIFDTLIVRNLLNPHELFKYIEDEVFELINRSDFDFHTTRRIAEKQAREKSTFEEVNLREIYQEFSSIVNGISDEILDKIMQIEISAEIKFCKQRIFLKKAFDTAKKLNKKIVIVSDMYLSEETINRILKNNNIVGFDKLYLSSEYRATKHTGNLFLKMLEDMNCPPKNVLHIGDNEHSDIKIANSLGIATYFCQKPSDQIFLIKENQKIWGRERKRRVFPSKNHLLTQSALISTYAHKFYSTPNRNLANESPYSGSLYKLGYEAVGSIFLGFADFVLKKAIKDKVDIVYFVARDGYLVKYFYDFISKFYKNAPKSEYLYSSRASFSIATIVNKNDLYKNIDVPFTDCDIRFLLKNRFHFDLNEEHEEILNDLDINGVVNYSRDLTNIKKLINNISSDLLRSCKNKSDALNGYLRSVGIFDKELNKAIVDIGYAGTTQNKLSELTGDKFHAYYFITRYEISNILNSNQNYCAYYANLVDHQEHEDSDFFKFTSMFEFIFGAPHNTVIYFDFDEGNNPIPIFMKDTENETLRRRMLGEIHLGARNFLSDFVNEFSEDLERMDFVAFHMVKKYKNFLNYPSWQDAMKFAGLKFEDAFGGHDQRFLIRDINECGNRNIFVEKSDWKNGANSIFLKNNNNTNKIAIKKFPSENSGKFLDTELLSRRFRKFKKNPKVYFLDSKYSLFRFFGRII